MNKWLKPIGLYHRYYYDIEVYGGSIIEHVWHIPGKFYDSLGNVYEERFVLSVRRSIVQ